MKNTDKYTNKELDEMAGRFKEINVDKAWDNVRSRIGEKELSTDVPEAAGKSRSLVFLRIAAAVIVLIGLGAGFQALRNSQLIGRTMDVASGADQREISFSLPDGSTVWLNRNSRLSYSKNMGRESRNVKLSGEAFFEIVPDASKPFIIDAGNANVKVLGTSFNVITKNSDNEVEVFVRTGKVVLSDHSGEQTIMLEPGSVGTIGSEGTTRSANENRNYMAWKTDTLVYEGEKLDIVFGDLKKVFNINISTDDPQIKNQSLTGTFFSQPEETIIKVICSSFNLRYEKDGSVYHLVK